MLLLLMLECDNKNVISINWLSNRSTHRVCLFSLLVHSQIQSPQLHSIDKVRLRRNAKKPYLTVLSLYFPCPMTSPLTGPIIGLHGLLATQLFDLLGSKRSLMWWRLDTRVVLMIAILVWGDSRRPHLCSEEKYVFITRQVPPQQHC